MTKFIRTFGRILACLLVVFAGLTAAQAQIFTDDAAREASEKNSEKIDALGRVMSNLRTQLVSMLQQQQALEQELRALAGLIEERDSKTEKSTESTQELRDNVVKISGQQEELSGQHEVLVQEIAAVTAQLSGQESLISGRISLMSGRISLVDVKADGVDGQLLTLSIQLSSLREQMSELADIVEVPREDDMYAVAFSAYQRQDYASALAGFEKILRYYPQGAFAVNARYWKSQALLSRGEYAEAAKGAIHIFENHGDSDKAPDALLILARAQQALEMENERTETLNNLIETYPTSLAADKARQMLYP